MSLPETLAKIDRDVADGDLGKARDRLHGLIVTYPNDLELRVRLGAIYWKLHDPAMAGRYWYLAAADGPEIEQARQAFERNCGNHPLVMLGAIRFRGDVAALGDSRAAKVLADLRQRAVRESGIDYQIGKPGKEKYHVPGRCVVGYVTAFIGGLALVVALGAVLLIGFLTIVNWFL